MPRTARAVVGGMCYHVLNRGNNRAEVFHSAADYARFIALNAEAQERVELDLFAACLMPNHFHLLVRSKVDEDLSVWMQCLLTSHVRRYHQQHRSSGRVWADDCSVQHRHFSRPCEAQGRFKAFPVQDDCHLLMVMRYVERNAMNANLVDRAESWPWGSLSWRVREDASLKLAPPPIHLPANWVEYVNTPMTENEVKRLQGCIHRQQPFGEMSWVESTAHALGLTSSLRTVGRPRKCYA